MNIFSLLDTDFLEICESLTEQRLDKVEIQFKNKATVCKYAVPNGYPDKPVKNLPINLKKIENPDSPNKAIIYPFSFLLLLIFGYNNYRRKQE